MKGAVQFDETMPYGHSRVRWILCGKQLESKVL